MTTEKFTFTLPIEIRHKKGIPAQFGGTPETDYPGEPPQCHGTVLLADDGNEEIPKGMMIAIEAWLNDDAGFEWMLAKIEQEVTP